ncbi:two-component sensor histidine kinase [Actinokineospora bangkokensis]|uniref:histidine kinase n=1 Tax=Actinokineospora bangkokensis TaxID=1193682 RepID=A0A1Q9LPZ3_9PSEU|nr:two-component sensor histidine kinase [Actinokineospora bangkokensis]
MSPRRRAELRERLRARPVSLRTRLIAEQLVLLALVCLVIGVVTLLGLRAYLVRNLEEQLRDASARATMFVQRGNPANPLPLPPGPREHPGTDAPGQGPDTLNATIQDGDVAIARRLTSTGDSEALPTDLDAVLLGLPVDGTAHDRELGGLGDYLLLASRTERGDLTVITGLPLRGLDNTLWTTALLLGGIALIGLTTAGVAGTLIVRRTLRPLDRMAATAQRVSELELDRGEVALSVRVPRADTDEHTEVGQVGAALNRMLGHIGNALAVRHASETRVRQFVADASHELRTPLAAISGYAELARRRQDDLPPDVAHALSRVGSESQRMTTLVEDLLLLARLDSGRPLLLETVDLSLLVINAVSDAKAAGPDHRWHLDLPAEPVHAVGDQARLHQVLTNLLANGRTHTPPGTTVTAGVRQEGDSAVLTVVDDGPGIPAELLPEVFERFARGDGSRNRAAGSTGLGLAIVAAVVQAHSGTVRVESVPGRTEFTVRLPAAAG